MLGAIGNTPVVRLVHLVEPGMAEVWVKLEAANPTGSYKDRMALAMIEGAERAGRLAPGQPVVEYTGGSTGSSLAFVCAVTGHPLHIVTSDAFAEEKRRTMEAFGALVEVAPEPRGRHPAAHPADAGPGASRWPSSSAPTRPTSSRTPTWSRATGGWAKSSSSSSRADRRPLRLRRHGGLLPRRQSGALREHYPDLQRVAVEPAESAVLSGGAPGTHRIEGGGIGALPDLLSLDDIDDVIAVSTADAFAMARRAARVEGLFSGPSTGANVIAALELARRLGEGRRVVTLQVDSGLKYLAGAVYVDGA